jgi:hypothetical protein
MRRILILLVFAAFLIGACNNGNDQKDGDNTDSIQTDQVSQVTLINVDDFDSIAENYVDKEIQVKGIIDHVCKHSGKRLFMVGDKGDLHIDAEERFNDSLTGTKLTVTGIVREFRVDESYCLQMEQDNIKNHSEGKTKKELFEQKKKQMAEYRQQMKEANVDHLSFYTLEYVSHKSE